MNQFSSVAQSCPTLCDPMNHSMPGLPVYHQLPEFTQTHVSPESVMPSSHLILCRPLLLLPPIPPSIRVFSNESTLCMRWAKYWSFSFSISPSSEYLGLISFRMDWLDLLAVQGTLKSLLQHHSSKASKNNKAEKPERGTVLGYITLTLCLVFFKYLLDYGWFSLTAWSRAKIDVVYLCLYQSRSI